MKLNDLKPAPGSKKARRRVGRGLGSGRGKTAGRGQKGQGSRSGFSQRAGWEGGRSQLIARLPKRGFNRASLQVQYQIVNIEGLNLLDEGIVVDSISLFQHGLIRHADRPVKILGRGELEVKGLRIDVDRISRSAASAIQALGGEIVRGLTPADDAAEADAAEEDAGAEAAAAAPTQDDAVAEAAEASDEAAETDEAEQA